jgi:hypothetical protein
MRSAGHDLKPSLQASLSGSQRRPQLGRMSPAPPAASPLFGLGAAATTIAMLPRHQDPIAAIATAPGRGAVGIVRLSGRSLQPLAQALTGRSLKPRHAHYGPLLDADAGAIDRGLALHFPAPHSATPARTCWSCRPRRPGGAADAAGALPAGRRPAARAPRLLRAGRTRRVHRARLPERQARPGAGRGRGRPDRRQHRAGGPRAATLAGRRVLARRA